MSQFVQFEDNDFQETEESKNAKIKQNIDFKQYLNVFEFETTLPGSNKIIKFKPMTTGQLKKLLSYEKTQNIEIIENIIDNLISECVVSKDFDINDLYIQDRFYLLIKLREKTKGGSYELTWTCPKCKSQSLNIIDISKLKINKKQNNSENIIKINDNLSIKVDIIIRGQEKDVIKYVEKTYKKLSEER
jgi:Zn finger protein HypA/HybF involved in hydrogenase expression